MFRFHPFIPSLPLPSLIILLLCRTFVRPLIALQLTTWCSNMCSSGPPARMAWPPPSSRFGLKREISVAKMSTLLLVKRWSQIVLSLCLAEQKQKCHFLQFSLKAWKLKSNQWRCDMSLFPSFSLSSSRKRWRRKKTVVILCQLSQPYVHLFFNLRFCTMSGKVCTRHVWPTYRFVHFGGRSHGTRG